MCDEFVQELVLGAAYETNADSIRSAITIRFRRHEWIVRTLGARNVAHQSPQPDAERMSKIRVNLIFSEHL